MRVFGVKNKNKLLSGKSMSGSNAGFRRVALCVGWLLCISFGAGMAMPSISMAQSFVVGAASSICPPVVDALNRKLLADAGGGTVGVGVILPPIPFFFSGKAGRVAALTMQIGINEKDEARLSQAIDLLKMWPDDNNAKLLTQAGYIQLAIVHHDLAALTAARKEFARLFQEKADIEPQPKLNDYAILVLAMLWEAAGLDAKAGRILLSDAYGLAQEALALAKNSGKETEIIPAENLAWSAQSGIAKMDRDAASLLDIVAKYRARLEQKNSVPDRQIKLRTLAGGLYEYAGVVGGADGLQALEESQKIIDEALALKSENMAGIWYAAAGNANAQCIRRAGMNITSANVTILTQALRSAKGDRADAAKLKEAVSILDRAEEAESRQPESLRPKGLDMIRSMAYWMLAKDTEPGDARRAWLDLAEKSLDADLRQAQTCFCSAAIVQNEKARAKLVELKQK